MQGARARLFLRLGTDPCDDRKFTPVLDIPRETACMFVGYLGFTNDYANQVYPHGEKSVIYMAYPQLDLAWNPVIHCDARAKTA